MEDECITITVEGYPYLIADYGEQLAWLSAAFAQNDRNIYRKPTITRPREIGCGEVILCFDIVVDERPIGSLPPQERWWTDMMEDDFVAIQGFPIRRRPKEFPGLEMSWEMLQELLGHPFIVHETKGRQTVLEGSRKRIALYKKADNVFLWHEVFRIDNSLCQSTAEWMAGHGVHKFEKEKFQSGRHVICKEEQRSKTQHKIDEVVEGKLSDGPFTPLSKPILDTIDNSTWRSNEPQQQSVFNTIRDHLVDVFDDCNYETADSADSLDTDLLSISEESDEIDFQPLNKDHPMLPIIQATARALLLDYRLQNQSRGQTTSGGTSSSILASDQEQTGNNSSSPDRPNNTCKKRNADGELKSGMESKNPLPETSRLTFACPFWKADYDKYHICATRVLTRVRDVKQHLKRNHTPAHYCQRCFEIFSNEDRLRGHVARGEGWACSINETGTLEGISHEQSKVLHKKSNPDFSDENQWFAIWEILFPTKTKPRSAYMNPNLGADLSAFQEHLSRHAAPAVHRALQEAGILLQSTEDESQHVRRVVNEAIYGMQQEWISNRAIARPVANTRHSHPQNHPGNSRTVGELRTPADSAIGLGSQTDGSNRRPSNISQQPNLSSLGDQRSSVGIEPQLLTSLGDAARNMPVFDPPAPTISSASQSAPNFWEPQASPLGDFETSSRMTGFGGMTGLVSPIDLSFWDFEEDVGHIAPAAGGSGTVEVPSPTA
ncbi:uncharacterized protein BDZ83DRAFT_234188 [Colletotrichum acutatum]|uniref:C2H2-type domain-containing protein n=1 Tax=Glomerella acutata TaxID=27357 RepID=A0AAD8U8S0_GLOAC|nr:uncharacterized protein BDZ83DRAFT_234188 [Colletotrichum acutatum]KAK1703488.1 hypothetical protein BDZ83DRAFT_234188 [Colletotrichum acutatum]